MLPDPPVLRENSLDQSFATINRSKTLIKAVFAQNRRMGHNKERSSKSLQYNVKFHSLSLSLSDVFKFDPKFEENEEEYKRIKREILDEGSSDEEGSGSSTVSKAFD